MRKSIFFVLPVETTIRRKTWFSKLPLMPDQIKVLSISISKRLQQPLNLHTPTLIETLIPNGYDNTNVHYTQKKLKGNPDPFRQDEVFLCKEVVSTYSIFVGLIPLGVLQLLQWILE